jgi:hypothetical protein
MAASWLAVSEHMGAAAVAAHSEAGAEVGTD